LHFQSENIQTAFNSIALRVCKPKKMEKWIGKTAVVTGASAGIGIAIVKSLVQHGVNVVGLARRVERVEVKTFPSD
jgi:3-oxoacyl-ACP reductase-like protein